MKIASLVFTLASVLLASVALANVLELKDDNFNDIVSKEQFVAVEFFAPWCGHCQKLEPEWKAAAAALATTRPDGQTFDIKLAAVDATTSTTLASKYEIKGFPTIKIFRHGSLENPMEYKGPREKDGIVTYLSALAGPASTFLADAAQAETKLADSTEMISVIAFGADPDRDLKVYTSLADKLRGGMVSFFHAASMDDVMSSLSSIVGTSTTTTDTKSSAKGAKAVMVKAFEGNPDAPLAYYHGNLGDARALESWVEDSQKPSVVMLSPLPLYSAVLQEMFGDEETPKILVFAEKWEAGGEAIKALKDATTNLKKNKVHVIGVDVTENKGAAAFFGIPEEGPWPILAGHNAAAKQKFVSDFGVALTAKTVEKFAKDLEGGKLKPFIKSEPIPEKDAQEGDVMVVVADSLVAEVVESGVPAMVEFYAPWCGHCKKLAPIWAELGTYAKEKLEGRVKIAMMDATANDITHPDFEVSGFPTLYYVGADGKAEKYEGGRELKDFQEFLAGKGLGVSSSQDEKEKGGKKDAKDEL